MAIDYILVGGNNAYSRNVWTLQTLNQHAIVDL